MLVAAGKHYICVEEITSIRCIEIVSVTGAILSHAYRFSMKNNEDFQTTVEEFDSFKTNCGRLMTYVFHE